MAHVCRTHTWSTVAVTAMLLAATVCLAQSSRVHRPTNTPDAVLTPQAQTNPTTKLPTASSSSAELHPTGGSQTAVQARYVGLVSWSYLRMHQPEAIVGMLQDVQAGKLSRSALNGLASPAVLTRLLGARWDLATIHGDPGPLKTGAGGQQPSANGLTHNLEAGGNDGTLLQAAPTSSTSRVMSGTAQSGPSPWELVRETGASRTVIGFPDYAPKQIDFAPLWDRQTSRLCVHLTALADGPITAALPGGGPFRIFSMATYDGPWQGAETGGAAPTRQQLLVTTRRISSGRTSPPWTVDATAGQDVTVVIAFEPDSFKTAVGDVNTVLQVTGNASTPSSPAASDSSPSDVAGIASYQPQGTAVAPDARICINFSQAMKTSLTQSAFWVRKDGTPTNVPGTFAWVGNEMQFTPTPALSPLTTYQVSVAATAKLATGAALGHKLSWRFTTRLPGPSGPARPTLAPRWTLKVPVHGRFEGLNLGVLFTADKQDIDLAAYPDPIPSIEPLDRLTTHPFDVSVKLVNTNAVASGEIRAESLPPGVSFVPVRVDIPAGATATRVLHFDIARASGAGPDNIYWAPHEVPYPIVLRYDANGKTSWLNLSLTLYDSFRVWDTGPPQAVGYLDMKAEIVMHANGTRYIFASGFNNHRLSTLVAKVWGELKGERIFDAGHCYAHPRSDFSLYQSYTMTQTPTTEAEFIWFLHQPLTISMQQSF